MKIRYKSAFYLGLLTGIPRYLLTSAAPIQPAIPEHIIYPITYTIVAGQYSTALIALQQLRLEYGAHPLIFLTLAGLYQTRMIDYENYSDEALFEAYLDSCEQSAYQLYTPDRKEFGFYMGTTRGYKAAHLGKKGSYYQAFKLGKKSINYLEQSLQLDSLYYNSYLGLGIYHYWVSKKTYWFSFLPGISNHCDQGIRWITLAKTHSGLMKYAAADMLAWVMIEEKRYLDAQAICTDLIREFPESRMFYWTQLAIAEKRADTGLKEKTLLKLLQLIQADTCNNHYNEVILLEKLGKLYHYQKKNQQCRKTVDYALNLPIDITKNPKIQPSYQSLKNLKKACR